MTFLLLAIVCSTVVGHVFTLASRRATGSAGLLLINYAVAAPASVIGMLLHPAPIQLDGLLPVLLAALLGFLFLFNYLMLAESIKHMGIALPVTLMRVSVAWPVVGSIVLFKEFPHAPTLLATAAVFLALPLASPQKIDRAVLRGAHSSGLLQAMLLFIATGLTELLFKVQAELHPLANPFVFSSMIFPVALLFSWLHFRRSADRIDRDGIALGAGLGLFNVGSTVFLLLALHLMQGIVVFPINAAGVIVLSTLSALFIWRERPTPRQWLFIAIACIAIGFIYH